MNVTEKQTDQATSLLALSILASKHGLDIALKLAQKEGLIFNKEIALKHIAEFLGEAEADANRAIWDDAIMAKQRNRLDKIIEVESAKLRQQHALEMQTQTKANVISTVNYSDHLLKSFEHLKDIITKTASELAQALFAPASQAIALRDQSNVATIEPVIDLHGNKLFVQLKALGGTLFLEPEPQINLYIEGAQQSVSKLVMHSEKNQINFFVEVDSDYEEKHARMSCTVHCNLDDLQEIIVELNSEK